MINRRFFLTFILSVFFLAEKSFAFFPFLLRAFVRSAPRAAIRATIRSRRYKGKYKKKYNIKEEIEDEFISQVIEDLIKKGLNKKTKFNITRNKKSIYNIIKEYNIDAIWVQNYNKQLTITLENKKNKNICGNLSIMIQDYKTKTIENNILFGKVCAKSKAKANFKITLDYKRIKIKRGIKLLIIKGPNGLKYISKPILVI